MLTWKPTKARTFALISDFAPSILVSFAFSLFLSIIIVNMSDSGLSNPPESRHSSPAPFSDAGTELTTITNDPGETQSVYRPSGSSQSLQVPLTNRPQRGLAKKRTSTQARLSVSIVSVYPFYKTRLIYIEFWQSSISWFPSSSSSCLPCLDYKHYNRSRCYTRSSSTYKTKGKGHSPAYTKIWVKCSCKQQC